MAKKKAALIFLQYCFLAVYAVALLSGIYWSRLQTEGKSVRQKQEALERDIRAALPKFDNKPWEEAFEIENTKVYPAREVQTLQLEGSVEPLTAHVLTGFAFYIPAKDGEGDNPQLAGVDLNGAVQTLSPSFQRKAKVPENAAPKGLKDEAAAFFEAHRVQFFEKANEARA